MILKAGSLITHGFKIIIYYNAENPALGYMPYKTRDGSEITHIPSCTEVYNKRLYSL